MVLAVFAVMLAAPGLVHATTAYARGSGCTICDDDGCRSCPVSGEACTRDGERVSCDSNISELLIFF